MRLENEIHFIPFLPLGANTISTDASLRQRDQRDLSRDRQATLRAALPIRVLCSGEGLFNGNDVPLVSRWTANAGVSWDIWRKHLVLDAVRYNGPRRMDNDQANFQPMIPSFATVDMRIGGEVNRVFWSVAVQNLFNTKYFDYAVASSSTFGTYNAYPQPGTAYMARLGVKFQ